MLTKITPIRYLIVTSLLATGLLQAAEPLQPASITGKYLDLLARAPKLRKLPKSNLTIEFWIRPNAQTIQRKRALVFLMTDRRGSDNRAITVGLTKGVINSTVLGTYLKASRPLMADKWTHLALTVNVTTVNKRARLWINGQKIASQIVLTTWPPGFDMVGMFGDPWALNRIFVGKSGGVRIANTVRYKKRFTPPVKFRKDKTTFLVAK